MTGGLHDACMRRYDFAKDGRALPRRRSSMPKCCRPVWLGIAFVLAQISFASAQGKTIVVASTTSTEDSGLFGFILPLFKQKTGIDVRVVARGTGQALDIGRRGDADVVFVHAKDAEEKFVAEGYGVKRYSVMYNDFVIIGPKNDPAGIKGARNVGFALQA